MSLDTRRIAYAVLCQKLFELFVFLFIAYLYNFVKVNEEIIVVFAAVT